MSAEAATPIKPSARSIAPGHAFLSGRIATARKLNTSAGPLWLTVVKLPAADQFSHPATIELRSNTALGRPGEEWTGLVRVSGMPNNYDTTDKDTGEKTPVRSARNELVVVEG